MNEALVFVMICLSGADGTTIPAEMDTFVLSQLTATIGDNGQFNQHRTCYNGVYSLVSPNQPESPFVPLYAGLNLEHYFDARPASDDSHVLFEPRWAPMTFKRIDAKTAELYQPESPVYGIESRTRFTFSDPYYVDMEFTCSSHKPMTGNFLGCFWASYINAPEDKSIYFLAAGSTLDAPKWTQFCTQQHNRDSTVLSEKDQLPIAFEPGKAMLYNNISLLRYSEPFFYGRFRDMVLIYVFNRKASIRFTQSPSGGGKTPDEKDTNPAWDFQFMVPNPQLNEEYAFQMRLIYKPWVNRDDVLREVRNYWAPEK